MQPNLPNPSPAPGQPRVLARLRAAIRLRHYRLRTEEAYVHWVKRFSLFHHKRHPLEMGAAEFNQFLTHLAVEGHVSASTQNQAFAALLFLYEKVLEVDPSRVAGVVRAKRPRRLPVVLTRAEVRAVRASLEGPPNWSAYSCTARACAFWTPCGYGSTTWNSRATNSWYAMAGGKRTA